MEPNRKRQKETQGAPTKDLNILNEFGTTTTVTSTSTSTVTATITQSGIPTTMTSVITSTSTVIQPGNSWLLPLTFIIVLLAVAVILSFVRRKKPVVPVES